MQNQRTGRRSIAGAGAPAGATGTAPANANANGHGNGHGRGAQRRSSGTPGTSTPFPSASAYKFEYPFNGERPTSPETVSAQDTQAFAKSLTKALKKARPFAITISIKTPPSILARRRDARSSQCASANGSLYPSTIASSVASSKHSPIMDARSHRSEDDFALGL